MQGPVWALCIAGDMLFSASSDNTIKVNGHVYATIRILCEDLPYHTFANVPV